MSLDEARVALPALLEAFEEAGDTYDGHALVALLRGRLDDAERWAEQALERYRLERAHLRVGGAVTTLGWIARVRRAPDAVERTEEGVRWFEAVGLGDTAAVTLTRMHALFVTGRLDDVMAQAASAAVAEWLVAEGRTGEARTLLGAALRHPGLDVEARQEAETLAARLPDGLRDGASERLTTAALAAALHEVVDGQPLASGTGTAEG